MQENQVSLTALATAFARVYHSKHDHPKIFDDFRAHDFFTEEERIFLEKNLAKSLELYNPELAASNPDQATALKWVMQNQLGSITLSRSRYAEDCLKTAVAQGVKQYVILGAGIDTFAFRQKELLKQLQVFELDHPATQGYKCNRLSELGWDMPKQLHFVPFDFSKESLVETLKRTTYDRQELSFFSWLGVSYYLTDEAVADTLRAIADVAASGSRIIFDYLDTDAFIPEKTAARIQMMQKVVARLGEPMKTGFDPSLLDQTFAKLGLTLKENLDPEEIEKRYFMGRTDDYHASEHIHFALARVK